MKKIQTVKPKRSWKRIGYGAFGAYYQMSKYRGIKVLHPYTSHHGDLSMRDLLSLAKKELRFLKKASKSGFAPKGYKIVKIRYHDCVSVGIVMQHINGRRYSYTSGDMRDRFEREISTSYERITVEEFLRDKLKKVGVYHDDLHTANILATVKNRKITKVYAIDFSPECSYSY